MDLDARLVRRYHQLVRSHMITSDLLSPGDSLDAPGARRLIRGTVSKKPVLGAQQH